MTPTIEITGIRVRRRACRSGARSTRGSASFTRMPMLLIDLELKGGGAGRVLGPTFMPLGPEAGADRAARSWPRP